MNNKTWFTVDRKGLKSLQEGKCKTFLLRELIQNALDEDITSCKVFLSLNNGIASIEVEDDSPEGFKDLSDSYTLFRHTSKRTQSNQRGRFNLGEKQVFSICKSATIITTKGGIRFDEKGRTRLRKKREKGSIIKVMLRMSQKDFDKCVDYCDTLLIPEGIKFILNVDNEVRTIHYKEPYKSFECILKTELESDGVFRPTKRKTQVDIHYPHNNTAYVYEMGIPVCEIECDYSIDIQQKVPLSADRDKVSPAFLKEVFAEALNVVHEDITNENASSMWVREATRSDRVNSEAVKSVVNQRYGDKALIANTNDPYAMDKAIAGGYNLIFGGQLDKDEWRNVKQSGAMQTSSEMFGANFVNAKKIKPNKNQLSVENLCKRIAKDFLNIDLKVSFLECPEANTVADYSMEGDVFRFNVSNINDDWWMGEYPKSQMLDLIIHELGHSKGWHYESSYHECITKLGGELITKAINNPKYFKL